MRVDPELAEPDRFDRINRATLFALVGASALLGGGFTAAHIAVRDLTPITATFGRYALTAVFLAPVFLWRLRGRSFDWSVMPRAAGAALFGAVGMSGLVYTGLRHGTAVEAAMTSALSPLFTTALAVALLRERVAFAHWVGLAISLLGVVVLSITRAKEGGAHVDTNVLWFVGGAVCMGMQSVLTAPLLTRLRPFDVVFVTSALGAVMLLVLFLIERPAVHLTGDGAAALIYLGPVMTAIGFTGWFFVMERIGVSRSSFVFYIVPVWGMAIGFLFGEPVTWPELAAAALIFAGLRVGVGGRRAATG